MLLLILASYVENVNKMCCIVYCIADVETSLVSLEPNAIIHLDLLCPQLLIKIFSNGVRVRVSREEVIVCMFELFSLHRLDGPSKIKAVQGRRLILIPVGSFSL